MGKRAEMKTKYSTYFITALILVILSACGSSRDGAGNKTTTEEDLPAAVVSEVNQEESASGGNKAVAKGTVLVDELEGRAIYMYLPEGYESSDERYPVVYMHDGQNVFDAATSNFGKEWRVDEVLDALTSQQKMEKVIVAAVAHGGSNRSYEYVPFPDPNAPSDGASAEQFTKYFIEEIIPYIDGKYRTLADRDHRMIMGSSFGGIQALWMGYNHPDVFSAVGAVSPSTWVGNMRVFDELERIKNKPDIDIWLDMGETEGMPIEELVDVLQSKGFRHGQDLFYLWDKYGQHDEISWSKRVHNPLLMFGGKDPEQAVSIEVSDYFTVMGPEGTRIGLNPVVTMDNGMSFTASELVSYRVLNSGVGKVDSQGSVTFMKPEALEVEVSYQGVKITHTVEYDPYYEIVLKQLDRAVFEKNNNEVTVKIKETAEQLTVTEEEVAAAVQSLEPVGFYHIDEMSSRQAVITLNEPKQ